MSQIGFYVDGFNFYHAVQALARPELKWVNLRKIAQSYTVPGDRVVATVYFTAILKWNPEKAARHAEYIKALTAVGVEVVQSKFQKVNSYCKENDCYCDFYEEKQTDVALAVRVLKDVFEGAVDRVVIVTADNDQIPLVETIRKARPDVQVVIAAPPGRMKIARELCATASSFGEITDGRLRTCLLPRNVEDRPGHVVARCPAKYLPVAI